MATILVFLVNAVAVALSAYLLPGVQVSSFWTALAVAIVLAVVNIFVRPLLLFLTLPLNILTLGLFTFVIDAPMIGLVAYLIPGFAVEGFLWAPLFSLVLSLVHAVLFALTFKI